jgi:hypothetical protein
MTHILSRNVTLVGMVSSVKYSGMACANVVPVRNENMKTNRRHEYSSVVLASVRTAMKRRGCSMRTIAQQMLALKGVCHPWLLDPKRLP